MEELRSRLESARELEGVVTTMKAMAAVNLRRYQAAAGAVADHINIVELGLQIVLARLPEDSLADRVEPPDGLVAIVLGADQGMAGAFNERLAEHARDRLAPAGQETPPAAAAHLLVMGSRARGALLRRGLEPDRVWPVPGSAEAIPDTVRDLLLAVDRRQREHGSVRLEVLHNAPTGGASFEPRTGRLLPSDLGRLRRLRRRPWPGRRIPAVLEDPRDLLSTLLRAHLETLLVQAIAESLAAENAARIAAMQSAERNLEERVEDLGMAVQRKRQQQITEELLDIVSGFEAIADGFDAPR